MTALVFLGACAACIALGYAWGREMGANMPEEYVEPVRRKSEDATTGPMVIWQCWKCYLELEHIPGTFEQPNLPTDATPVIRGKVCRGCGAYNVLMPVGMHARLQEVL